MSEWKSGVNPQNEIVDENADENTYLLFFSGGELYGTRITDVREIIAPQPIKPVADTQPWVKGIINLRGEVLLVVDLRQRLFTDEPPSKCFMVVETERGSVALVVDKMHAVTNYKSEEIHDRTLLQVKVKNEHFIGVGKKGEETAVLLDLKRVFTEEDLVVLSTWQAS